LFPLDDFFNKFSVIHIISKMCIMMMTLNCSIR